MTDIEIFENLIKPIKSKITPDQYEFIISRFNIFLSQKRNIKPKILSNLDDEQFM